MVLPLKKSSKVSSVFLLSFSDHTSLLEEADGIFEDLLIAVVERLRVVLRFDLRESFFALFLHTAEGIGDLKFQDDRAPHELEFLHHDIRPDVSTLTVVLGAAARDVRQESCHKTVIEALGMTEIADGIHLICTLSMPIVDLILQDDTIE